MLVPMKRLTLIGLRAEEERIMSALQRIAAVQIIPGGDEKSESEALSRLTEETGRILDARGLIKPYGCKAGMAPPPEATMDELYSARAAADALCADIERLSKELAAKQTDIEKRKTLIAQLTPFAELDTPVENIKNTKNIRYITGIAGEQGLGAALDLPRVLDTDIAVEVYEGNREFALLIGCYDHDYDAVMKALKEMQFTEYTFPRLTGSVKENIASENAAVERLLTETAAIEEALCEKAKGRERLEMAYDAAAIERDREAGKNALVTTDYAFVLEGWVREDRLEDVEKALAEVTDACHIEFRDPQEGEIPPSALKNNKLATPFESVTNLYSRPAYAGLDPTSIMTPFYMLFFGMMLSDSGYGLVLFIGALLYQKLLKPRGGTKQLAEVICLCGLTTVFIGLLIGTFFGMNWGDIFGPNSVFPLIDPLSNIMTMIIICCGFGLIHMMVGIGIKAYMCFREGDVMAGIFDHISWMLLLIGLVGVLAAGFVSVPWLSPVCTGMAALGGAMILLFAGRTKKNVFKRVGGGLGALYNITSYLGDTLSYVRILALGLVSGAMGMVFNLIGTMVYDGLSSLGVVGAIIGFILAAGIICALHAFSLFINTLGTYVHCARLQYVEFFGKFYDPNGFEFRPLGFDSKYVKIKQQ